MKGKRAELLSPAGNIQAFYGAINAGADAIYVGAERFSARAYAENFTTQQLIECIELAHLKKVKVYLTVNTLLKETEIDELYDFISPLYFAGLDGVIIQDLGVARVLAHYFPDLERHASTQMTLTNHYSLEFLEQLGFTRVVLSRELTLKEIQYLKEKSNLELECFIHGAMCYCYSGQCLYSSVLGGRSGNRGRCAQPCRLPLKVIDDAKTETDYFYPLSMKDQETAGILDKLIKSSIDSFKIEGRMKRAEYSAGVTATYRRMLDRYYETGKLMPKQSELQLLAKLYRRSDKQEGYYLTQNGECMITKEKPSYNPVEEELLSQIQRDFLHEPTKLSVTGFIYLMVGEAACLTIQYEDISVSVVGEIVEEAKNRALTKQEVEKQINKLGDTSFCMKELEVVMVGEVFYAVRCLNELRRAAIEELKAEILRKNGFPIREKGSKNTKTSETEHSECLLERKQNSFGYSIVVCTKEQLSAVNDSLFKAEYIYLDYSLFLKLNVDEFPFEMDRKGIYVSLPPVYRMVHANIFEEIYEKYKKLSKWIAGFEVHNLEELQWLKSKTDFAGELVSSEHLYCYNSQAAAFLKAYVNRIVLPWEQTKKEALHMLENKPDIVFEKIAYGRTRLMVTANCLAKTTKGCKKDGLQHRYFLYDRMKTRFPVRLDCAICCNSIYNSVPFCSFDAIELYHKHGIIRFVFTVESREETLQVLKYFEECNHRKPGFAYTACFEKRVTE